MLANRLAGLDDDALRSRSRQLGYVAGGTRIDTLQFLVNAAVPALSRDAFVKIAVDEYGIAESSAEQSLGSLRLMGLLEQVGPDSFAATDVATEWLASNDPVDLIRVLHLSVALVGETLDVVASATTAAAAAGLLVNRYPEIEIGRGGTARRITLLQDVGLVERVGIALRRTPLGDALVATLPLLSTAGADTQAQPSYTRGILGVREIWREGKTMLETPLDDGEIRDALAFLTSPFVASVSGVDNGYVVATPPRAAAARLRALATMIDAVTPPESGNPSRPWQSTNTEPPVTQPRPADVRAWAKSRGRGISDRGRLSQRVVQEYLDFQRDQ